MRAARDSSMASLRSRYSSRKTFTCSRHGCVAKYSRTMSCARLEWQSTADSAATTSPPRTRERGRAGRADHRGLGGEGEPVPDPGRSGDPAHPQAGGDGLGERAQVHHAVRIVGTKGPLRLPVQAEQPIRVVLDHREALTLADAQYARPARGVKGDSSWVME